jgi:hypothetical protein
MRSLYFLACGVALVGAYACGGDDETGSGGAGGSATGAGGTMTTGPTGPTGPSSSSGGPSSSSGGGTPVFDNPGAASFQVDFNIVDDGDGTFSANGTWLITLLEYANGTLGQELCLEQFDFTADIDLPLDLMGCDENGMNCTVVCPYDDPAEAVDPTGLCIGHFGNLVGDAATYATDCNLMNETDWFHPDGGGLGLLERFWFSRPVEDAIPTGATGMDAPATWGDWGAAIEAANMGFVRSLQVQFVNNNMDDTLSENGFMFGVGASDDGAELDQNAVGHHFVANLFLLVFN